MFNLLVPRLRAIGHKSSALDYFLPRFSALFPGEFYCFADCGAAVGDTVVKYAQIQSQFLTEDAAKKHKYTVMSHCQKISGSSNLGCKAIRKFA
jgi:hypothetical protein